MKTAAVALPPSLSPEHPDYRRERYDVRQAAEYLCLSPSTVYQEAAAGRLSHRRQRTTRAEKRGGRLWFSQADLDAWRESARVETAPRSTSTPTFVPLRLTPLPMPKKRRFS